MERIIQILGRFKNSKILVLGDLMLDRYLEGDVSRISPEAPVLIVKIEKEFSELGGAGNVASNIVSLGGEVFLFGFIGRDEAGNLLKEILEKRSIPSYLEESGSTIEKTRMIGRGQQLLRFDKEDISDKILSEVARKKILEKADWADKIIISDYAKGAITSDLMNLLSNHKKKIIVDPKPKNKSLYKGVLLTKLNEKESAEMSGEEDILKSGNDIRAELGCNILITRGEKGMTFFSETGNIANTPTYVREVYDVTGAGDTTIATISLALAAGASFEEAIMIANHAAGIAVEKKGTYSVSLNELESRMFSEERKIVNLEELDKLVQDYKRKGRKIVWTNGCFDLLHVGHVKYLQEAKKLGNILIIGLNSDDSVRKLKGEGRPIQNENDRAEILASLGFVDYIIIFPEPIVEKYLLMLKPDIFIKGADYDLEKMNQTERKAIESYNGKISFIPLVEGKSTSDIVTKLRK